MNEELKSIVDTINQLSTELNQNGVLSTRLPKVCLEIRIKTGELLKKSQSQVDGNWEEWFKATITTFDIRTAYRYISLFDHLTHVSDCESTREAYRVIEQLKDNPLNLFDLGDVATTETEPESWSLEKELKKPINKIMKLLKDYHVEDEKYLALLTPIAKYYNKRKGIKTDTGSDLLDKVTRLVKKQKVKDIMDEAKRTLKGIPVQESKPVQPPPDIVRTE